MARNQQRSQKRNMYESDEDDIDFIQTSRKGSKKVVANHLLNFQVERRLQTAPHTKHYNQRNYAPQISQGQFLQANFQFIVRPDFVLEQTPDQFVKWEQVDIVLFNEESALQISKCPICLEAPRAPRITRCGHIFCWTCLLRMFQASLATRESTNTIQLCNSEDLELEVDERYKQCPLCTEMVALHQLKPVKVLLNPIEYTKNSYCEFILLKRYKNSFIVQAAEDYSLANEVTLPEHGTYNANFSRFHKDKGMSTLRELLRLDVEDLQRALTSADDDEKCFVELGILQIQKQLGQCEEMRNNSKEEERGVSETKNEEDYVYLYQEISGKKLYLHPLNCRALLNQYGSYQFAPRRLRGRILDMERLTIDSSIRKRFKFLSHLPVCTSCQICELDMRPLVSKEALEPLVPKIMKRIRQRRQKKFTEQKEDEKRKEKQIFDIPEPIVFDSEDFAEALPSSHGIVKDETSQESVEAPVWVKETNYPKMAPIPKQLRSTSTSVRKVKGSDGESDEELAAPSFAASVYQDISFGDPLPTRNPKKKPNGKRKKKQRGKQMLFSTSQISYS